MYELRGKIDENDLQFVWERYGEPSIAMPCPIKYFGKGEYQGKINPHVTRFFIKGKIVDVFHVKPIYYLHKNGQWRPMSEVAHGFGNKWIDLKADWDTKLDLRYLRWLLLRIEIVKGKLNIPSPFGSTVTAEKVPIRLGQEIFLTTSTFYPDPNVEITSVDGIAFGNESPSCKTWTSKRTDNTSTQQDDAGTELNPLLNTSGCSSPDWSNIVRAATLFDTSAIGDTDTIDSGTWSGYVTTVNDNFSALYSVVTTSPSSNTAISAGDYYRNSLVFGGGTKVATDVDLTGLSTGAYKDSTLNATGLSNISKTSVTKFGVSIQADVDNSEPTWAASTFCRVIFSSADVAGTTQDPKLVVNHTAAGGMNLRPLLGVG